MGHNLVNSEVITQIRQRAQFYVVDQDYESAIFWLEKIYMFTRSNSDLYFYVQSLLMGRRYRLAISALLYRFTKKMYEFDSEMLHAPLWARYLLAKCYSNLGMTTEALTLISDIPDISNTKSLIESMKISMRDNASNLNQTSFFDKTDEENFVDKYMLISACSKLKGTLFEYQSRNDAAQCYSQALITDLFAYSAARKLIEDRMLIPAEIDVLSNLVLRNISQIWNSSSNSYIIAVKLAFFLYNMACGSYALRFSTDWRHLLLLNPRTIEEGDQSVTDQTNYVLQIFGDSVDLKRWRLKKASDMSEDSKALQLSKKLVDHTKGDSFYMLLHALTLFKLRQYDELNIVTDNISKDANLTLNDQINYKIIASLKDISQGRPSQALESLRVCVKLTSAGALRLSSWLLPPSFLWILLGHCAWQAGDKEYALASYNSAADSSPGDYLTWQYIGALHAELKEISLSLNYYIKGYKVLRSQSKYNPLILTNEIAVNLMLKNKYDTAERLLKRLFPETSSANLINELGTSKHAKEYSIAVYNLSFCLLQQHKIVESYKYCDIALNISKGTVNLYKLAGVLANLRGFHVDARFMYESALMEASKINEAKFSPKHCQNVMELPPRVATYSSFKEVETFCNRMVKKSIELELNTKKNRTASSRLRTVNDSNRTILP